MHPQASAPVPVSIIVAMAANRAIGKDNRMPWHLPADLKHFKEATLGCPVIMGRKTFESILASLGKPLPGRRNIVITRNPAFQYPGITSAATPEAALAAARSPMAPANPPAPTVSAMAPMASMVPAVPAVPVVSTVPAVPAVPAEVFVIGGAEIYCALLPLAQRIVATEIGRAFDGDAFFPALDPHQWRETARQPQPASGTPSVTFDFVEYRRQ